MKTSKLDILLCVALAIGVGGMIAQRSEPEPEPQPTELPIRDNEQSVIKPKSDPIPASKPQPEPAATPTIEAIEETDFSPPPVPVIAWETYLPAARAEAERTGKPLLIYVTADYCVVCKQMEQTTYKSQEVVQQLSRFVLCKLDAEGEYPGSGTVKQALRVDKLPYFVITDPAGKVLHQGAIEPAKLLSVLEKY